MATLFKKEIFELCFSLLCRFAKKMLEFPIQAPLFFGLDDDHERQKEPTNFVCLMLKTPFSELLLFILKNLIAFMKSYDNSFQNLNK